MHRNVAGRLTNSPEFCYERPMGEVRHGHLLDTSSAPATGERAIELVRCRNLTIEQVLSGAVALPAGIPHRLLGTSPGTNWLIAKLGPGRG